MSRIVFLCLPVLFLSACETTETTRPSHLSTTRGLQEEAGQLGNKALIRKSDPSTLARYNKVIVENVRVALPKHPDPKVERASQSEAQQLARRFEEILREELRSHYQITNRKGRDTLAVRATLTELQPSKPGAFVLNYLPYVGAATAVATLSSGKTVGAGSTTVEAEVVDSYSRRQVYALVDRFGGTRFQPGGLERWGQTEAAMRNWSHKIRSGIDKATPKQASSKRAEHPVSEQATSKKGPHATGRTQSSKATQGVKQTAHTTQHSRSVNQVSRIGNRHSGNVSREAKKGIRYSRIQSR